MVGDHRLAHGGQQGVGAGRRGFATVAGGFLDQTRLIEQLIALQHPFLVPGRAVEGEHQPGAGQFLGVGAGPGAQGRFDGGQGRWAPGAPVLPREDVRPRPPLAAGEVGVDGGGRQRQIADRDHPRLRITAAEVGHRRIAALVAEGVELFDIPKVKAGLFGDEGSQRQFERPIAIRIERSERQADGVSGGALRVANGQGHGFAVANGDHHSRQSDDDGSGRAHSLTNA